MTNIEKYIQNQIKNNKTILYMKGSPQNPICKYSAIAVNILNTLNIEYIHVNVLENQELKKALTIYSNWHTFPQLYHNENLIGGVDVMAELQKKNELKNILKQ
ncbi:MAG TPA: glutaredoxin domain-containing protein [Candidatus Azoamicus sp. OHIO1]